MQPADNTPRIYTDDKYWELDDNLESLLDPDAVRKHAAASEVIIHDSAAWIERPVLCLRITDTRSAYKMEYLALELETQVNNTARGAGYTQTIRQGLR